MFRRLKEWAEYKFFGKEPKYVIEERLEKELKARDKKTSFNILLARKRDYVHRFESRLLSTNDSRGIIRLLENTALEIEYVEDAGGREELKGAIGICLLDHVLLKQQGE